MSGSRPTIALGVLVLVSAAIVGCSGSTSPSLSADNRCGGISHVPAWQMVIGVQFADTGVRDSFDIRLHQDLDPSGLSHAISDVAFNDTGHVYRQWTTGVPGGAFAEHDTIINTATPDTVSATSYGYAAGSLIYLSVDLATCTATVGGTFMAHDSLFDAGPNPGFDTATVPLGYAVFANIPVDSSTAVNGLVNAGTKVYTFASGTTTFDHLPEYQVGGLSGPYLQNNASQVLDSAMVGYIITAAAAPAPSAPANGADAAPAISSRWFAGLLAPPLRVGSPRP